MDTSPVQPTTLTIAAAQFPVSADLSRNLGYVCRQISRAASGGADVVLFPETAMCGYAPKHLAHYGVGLAAFDWPTLAANTVRVQACSRAHGIWTVLGSMRRNPSSDRRPLNCQHVIDPDGQIVATYDKQRLYDGEIDYYAAGCEPSVVTINGHRCGFLICYDNCFPELYETYRALGAGVLFHSMHNANNTRVTPIKDLIYANQLVRAADHQMWIAASNSSTPYCPHPAAIARPDGSILLARRHRATLVFDTYPSASLEWTYDNRAGRRRAERGDQRRVGR